jgi:hypothetical protein
VHMVNTIHDITTMNTGRKDSRTNLEIKKPHIVVHYNKLMKGINGQISTSVVT